MRVALVRWRAEQDGELTTFVPDVDLDALDAWGVIDLRGSGEKHQSSADGVALLVAPRHEGPVPGALVDLGDDHQSRLGTTVGRALSNRLGLNLVEATPGRIAAELLTLHARAGDDSKPNPLVGERRFPRSKSDQRRRARVWCAGVLLYDELGGFVDEEAVYYTETFPTAQNPMTSQDLQWSGNFVVASGGAYAYSAAVPGFARMETAHASADHWIEAQFSLSDDSALEVHVRCQQTHLGESYAMRVRGRWWDRWALWRYINQFSVVEIGNGGCALNTNTEYTIRLEANGSSITPFVDTGTGLGSQTDTNFNGLHVGLATEYDSTPTDTRFYSLATALIGEEPGGGGDPVEGEATAALGALTGAATGVATVVGEASSSLGALSATATGTASTPPVEGTATATLGALTGTASGTTTVVGAATSTLGGLTATATGTVQGVVNGQATANLGALAGTATGVRATAGTAAATLGGLTATADGQPTVVGEAASQLGGLTGTASGGKTVVGQAAAHLGGLDGHAVGEGATTVEGEATANLGGLTGTATGVRTTAGAASSSLGGITAAGTGQVRVLGAAATVLGGVTAEATGDVTVVATATATLGGLTGTGTGTRTVTGAATAALGALTGAVVIVTADPNPLSVTIRETGHRVVARDTGHRVTTKERR